jgi:hypothetical protein
MKLRNKKTGNVYTLSDDLYIEYTQGGKIELRAIIPGGNMSFYYDSLDKLYHEWEDYEPADPLIKDEKIRKAVRAWAEANNVTKVWHEGSSVGFCDGAVSIKFHELCWEEIPKGEYTIAELCGKEKE